MEASIDEVIQSGVRRIQPLNGPANGANRSSSRTVQVQPPPVATASQESNPRKGKTGSPLQSHPPAVQNERIERIAEEEVGHETRSQLSPARESIERSASRKGLSHDARGGNITDFFSAEVFQMVIHNPTTAHRFLRFCQSRNCGENLGFLQKVDMYNRLLDQVTQVLSEIHSTYTSPDAPHQINISHSLSKRVTADIKQCTNHVIPSLENVFTGATSDVEALLASDIYPRFVRHQVTASATMALADHRERYPGLGDCFCLTDPTSADNPIRFASDGFVSVTGYNRKDIIPRNCRFLQGELTDPNSAKRLRKSIDSCEETVELLLNYRKNGDPFWNLLYVSPLLNEEGEVVFFLGGQINCSTTIHSCTDVLKVLSATDDELDRVDEAAKRTKTPSIKSKSTVEPRIRSSFFKSFRKYKPSSAPVKVNVRDEAGMEPELLNRLGKLSFRTQVEAFYTAYSKYLVLQYNAASEHLLIRHYSPGVIDMLCLNLPNGGIAPIFHKDIFKILAEHSSSAAGSVAKAFKATVRNAIYAGSAVSVEVGLLTGYEERRAASGLGRLVGGGGAAGDRGMVRVEERYVTHWTPLKDEEGVARWVVLTIAPKG